MPSAPMSGNILFLTIGEIFGRTKAKMPSSYAAFKKAERLKKSEGVQQSLDLDM